MNKLIKQSDQIQNPQHAIFIGSRIQNKTWNGLEQGISSQKKQRLKLKNFVSKKQTIIHDKVLQQYTSIYLGDNSSDELLKNNELMKNHKFGISILNTQQQFSAYIQNRNREIRNKQQNLKTKQQLIKELKCNPFIKISKNITPNKVFIEDKLDYQTVKKQNQKYNFQQKQILKQYVQNKKRKEAEKLKFNTHILKFNASVPSYIDQLLNDIDKLNKRKQQLKYEFFKTEHISNLYQIIKINESLMKPVLQDFLIKILELKSRQDLQTIDIELEIMISYKKSQIVDGRSKKQLLKIFTQNVKAIKNQQRQFDLTKKNK